MEEDMKSAARILLGMTVFFAVACIAAQDKPLVIPPKSRDVVLEHPEDSASVQLAYEKEKNLQLSFQLMQKQVQEQQAAMQAQYATLEGQINDWIAKVKKENHLGDDVQYDREANKWVRVSKPVATAPATPKFDAKPKQ
jgi:hypothetical protein